eukprot:1007069-Prorocentrum_minimum.AAC.1
MTNFFKPSSFLFNSSAKTGRSGLPTGNTSATPNRSPLGQRVTTAVPPVVASEPVKCDSRRARFAGASVSASGDLVDLETASTAGTLSTHNEDEYEDENQSEEGRDDIPGAGTNRRRDGMTYLGREPIGGGTGGYEDEAEGVRRKCIVM